MEKHKKAVDPDRYVTVTNLDGTKAELLRESYEQSRLFVQEILQDQEKCRHCDGIHCTQPVPYWVLLLRSGIDSTPTPAMARCPKQGSQPPPDPKPSVETSVCSSLPVLYQKATFADFEVTEDNRQAVEGIQAYLEKPEVPWVYLTGGPGTGKTFLACIAANELLRRGRTVHFQKAEELLEQLRKDVRQKSDENLDRYSSVPCLVLDNLGPRVETEWAAKQLERILSNRYDQALPTLITSPYSMKELRRQLVPRGREMSPECKRTAQMLVSRLAHFSTIHHLGGPDRRIRKQVERRSA